MRIKDPQLNALLASINANANGKQTLDATHLNQLLAAVADTADLPSDQILEAFQLDGRPDADKIAYAKQGARPLENTDLMEMLESPTLDISAALREARVKTLGSDFRITGDTLAMLKGRGPANASMQAINLSAIPPARKHTYDVDIIGTSDANGRFDAVLPESVPGRIHFEGDVLQIRAGQDGEFLQFEARSADASSVDVTNASLNVDRIEQLTMKRPGEYEVSYDSDRPISEPGALVWVTNDAQPQMSQQVEIGIDGKFPAGYSIYGQPGDTISLAVSDGTNNLERKPLEKKLTIPTQGTQGEYDLPDPAPMNDHRSAPKYRFSGATFVDGADIKDSAQGAIGDCFFPAAITSLVWHNKDLLASIIDRKKVDGRDEWRGTFKNVGWNGSSMSVTTDATDGDLYTRGSGRPIYMTSISTPNTFAEMEMYPAMIEKLYALYKGGGYEALGQGGIPGDVMTAILGKAYDYVGVTPARADQIYKTIKEGGEKKWPMAAGTYDDDALYSGTGVYANHAYTVMGAEEEGGVRYVKLRNPWGTSEPAGNGANDGIFRMKLEDFVTLYDNVNIVRLDGSTSPNKPPAQTPLHGSGASVLGAETPVGHMNEGARKLLGLVKTIKDAASTPAVLEKWLRENYGDRKRASSTALLQARKEIERLIELAREKSASGLSSRLSFAAKTYLSRFDLSRINQSEVVAQLENWASELKDLAAEKAKKSR